MILDFAFERAPFLVARLESVELLREFVDAGGEIERFFAGQTVVKTQIREKNAARSARFNEEFVGGALGSVGGERDVKSR